MTGMRGRIGEVSGGVDDGLESGTSIKGKDEGVMQCQSPVSDVEEVF